MGKPDNKAERTGWSSPEMWNARAARIRLRQAIDELSAVRLAAAQNDFTIRYEHLERRRQTLARKARRLPEGDSQGDALMQSILRYYHDAGELDRAVATSARLRRGNR